MKLGFVTDSTSDLPADLAQQYDVAVIPSVLAIDGKEYIDGRDITREEFYTRLPTMRTPPTTAAPSIGDFAQAYDALFAQGCDHVISIHASARLTSIVNVARQAAQDFAGKVTCVDSGSLTMGIGFQVLAAVEQASLGLQAALEAMDSTRRRLQIKAALDTMEYLKRSGRVPKVVAALGSALAVKPMVELLNDGEVKPIGAARLTRQADERMLGWLLENGEMERLALLHTNAETRARKLLEGAMNAARKSLPREIFIVNVTAVIGAHLGPNGVGFAAVRR